MKFFIGPDSFKNCISASEFCEIAKEVILSNWEYDEVIAMPLADGGEGTVDALVKGTGGNFVSLEVTGPLGENVIAKYGLIQNNQIAVIEMASASGLSLVPQNLRNPMKTTTYGTGELILDAISNGCKKIILGIGGSATNDAGLGMMQALGYKCLDVNDEEIPFGGDGLIKLKKIISPKDKYGKNPYENISISVACDVTNPLYGPNGAAYVYGSQKGADNNMITILDNGLRNFSECVYKSLGIQISNIEGAGAAGGLGGGLLASLNCELVPGFKIVSELLNLDLIIDKTIDYVITGEGKIDYQSLNGKLPIELSKLAQYKNIPTIAFVGEKSIELSQVKEHGIVGIFSIQNKPMSVKESIESSESMLREALYNVISLLHQTHD